MHILLAILVHDRHGTVRIRVSTQADAYRYLNHGWRLIGFETFTPKSHRR
jgi:hypothetical protein